MYWEKHKRGAKASMPAKYLPRFAILIFLAAFLSFSLSATGCSQGVSQAEVSNIDKTLREGSSRIPEVTGFLGALKEFDFENANFYQNALSSIGTSKNSLQIWRASIDKLSKAKYGGGLAQLGEYMQGYIDATLATSAKLDGVYEGLDNVLKAVQPILKEEAVISVLEEPGSTTVLLDRLEKLKTAAQTSLDNLLPIEVTDLLASYKALFQQLVTTLLSLINNLIAVVSTGSTTIDTERNPDFDNLTQLIASYPAVIQELSDELNVSTIDASLEQVELEINRLYLGEN
jgi:hypothetical protein